MTAELPLDAPLTRARAGKWSGVDLVATLADPKVGERVSGCPCCNEAFASESLFVWHRIDKPVPPKGHLGEYWLGDCRSPEDLGMTLTPKGVWKLR